MTKTILIVEDDLDLRRGVADQMSNAGFSVRVVDSAERGDAVLRRERIDLVILDLKLPDGTGLDLLKEARSRTEVPIIIVTALSEPALRIRGLQLGADDFLLKPFWPPELLARVEARLRRPMLIKDSEDVAFGPVRIESTARRVVVSGEPVNVTRAEFEILRRLVAALGMATTRASLALASDTEERSLDVHVSNLRRKLGPTVTIATVWGIGYRLEAGSGG
jgi:two-component system response regulator MtrA